MWQIKVVPGASQIKVEKIGFRSLRVKLTEETKEGRANRQLIKVLADFWEVKPYRIKLKKGFRSPIKYIEVRDGN